MLLGFISLLLTASQKSIDQICIPKRFTNHMLPCKREVGHATDDGPLLSEEASDHECSKKGMAPFFPEEAQHQLHIFIFVLAIVHCIFCLVTMLLASAKVDVFNHICGSVSKSDYITLRMGFIQTHCRLNKAFDFHKYMMRTLEGDFKIVVGISAHLWVFVVIFLLINIDGLHIYFWLAFLPLILALAVGAKLQHIITRLAQEVAEKHTAVEGEIVVRPSDEHFWFGRPKLVLYLIHFILFQNSFEMAFLFWVVMGSSYKKSIFDENVQQGLLSWHQKVKDKAKQKSASNTTPEDDSNKGIHMFKKASSMERGLPPNVELASLSVEVDIPKSK